MFAKVFNPREFTGGHMLAVLFLFFGTIIAVNLTLAWFANSTWTGLVVKNGYIASQEFDEKTRELERQLSMGWQASVSYSGNGFTAYLKDASGKPLHVEKLTATIGHPVTESADRVVDMISRNGGAYTGKTVLAPGIWEVLLEARSDRYGPWTKRIRFTVGG